MVGTSTFSPQRGLRDRDRNAAVNVVANSRKERMWRRIDYNVEIAARPAKTPRIAFTCHANSGSCSDSRRQAYFQSFRAREYVLHCGTHRNPENICLCRRIRRTGHSELKVSLDSGRFAGTTARRHADFT